MVPSCLAPLEVVASGSPRSQAPRVAVSVPFGLTVQPVAVSKVSLQTVVVGGCATGLCLTRTRPCSMPLMAIVPLAKNG